MKILRFLALIVVGLLLISSTFNLRSVAFGRTGNPSPAYFLGVLFADLVFLAVFIRLAKRLRQ
jgi:hypothetical protein